MSFFQWADPDDEPAKLMHELQVKQWRNELELQLAFANGALEEKRRWNDLVMSWMQQSEIEYGRASDRVRDLENQIRGMK